MVGPLHRVQSPHSYLSLDPTAHPHPSFQDLLRGKKYVLSTQRRETDLYSVRMAALREQDWLAALSQEGPVPVFLPKYEGQTFCSFSAES